MSIMLAGCGTLVELDGVQVRCNNRTVSVINAAGRLQVRPESVSVCRGFSVTLEFRNPVPARSARTTQSATGAPWLDAENSSTDAIVLTVLSTTTPMEYKYSLEIDGLGLLDPRIVVQ